MRLQVGIYGDEVFKRKLYRIEGRSVDVEAVFLEIAEDIREVEEKQFESEGWFRSGGWAELTDNTIARKEREGLDPRILHATLKLRESVTDKGGGTLIKIGEDTLVVGSEVSYGGYHQTGTSRMPQRKVMEFNENDKRQWVMMIERWIIHGEIIPRSFF